MKRSPMKRGTKPMRRGTPLRSRKPMKRVNAKRGGHKFPKLVDEARRAHCRTFPCVACVASGALQELPTLACHRKSRGAGGTDVGNLYPACDRHHTAQHLMGVQSFQRKYALNLARVCERIERAYQAVSVKQD